MSIAVQKQIRDNSEDIRGCLDDLYKWTTEISKEENSSSNSGTPAAVKEKPPIRGTVSLQEEKPLPSVSSMPSVEDKRKAHEPYVRDQMKMKEYYRAWDHFDVDAEEEKIEKEAVVTAARQKAEVAEIAQQKRTTNARPNMKVELRSFVRAKSDEEYALAKKEEANKLFTQQRLRESRDAYTQALSYLKCNCELRATLLANRAMCHLKLNDFAETIKDTAAVLEFDPSHVKARFRKAMAHSKVRNWTQAQHELQIVVDQDPEDKKARSEFVFVTRMVNEETEKRREHAKRLMTYKRPLSMPLRRLNIEERLAGVDRLANAEPAVGAEPTSAPSAPLRVVTKTECKKPYVLRSLRATQSETQEGADTAGVASSVSSPSRNSTLNATKPPRTEKSGAKSAVSNFYEFERRWRAEKNNERRWELLNEWDLAKLCRESFSSELLAEIIEACDGHTNTRAVLAPLQDVRRWDMALSGLTRSERATLEGLIIS
eukprot:GEMP01029863.1.p1 GENE.GEMP01029863.1~~GEMP01029863.1.p1  ORF type:complete len:487 (+),score=107.94 GEMP01029863.1:29-1489(+)